MNPGDPLFHFSRSDLKELCQVAGMFYTLNRLGNLGMTDVDILEQSLETFTGLKRIVLHKEAADGNFRKDE